MKSCRLVRFLMLRGANKDVKDKNGKKPEELIPDVTEAKLRNELTTILGPPSRLDCLMLSPPNRLTKKKPNCMITYLALFMGMWLFKFLVVYGRLYRSFMWIDITMTFLCLFFLMMTNCTGGGRVKNEVDFYDLVRVVDST